MFKLQIFQSRPPRCEKSEITVPFVALINSFDRLARIIVAQHHTFCTVSDVCISLQLDSKDVRWE